MYQPEPYPGLEVVGVESQYGPYADAAGKANIPPTVRSEPPRTPKKTWIIAAAAVAGRRVWHEEENPKTLRRWARQWRAEARDLEVKIRNIRRWQKSSS